MFYKILYLIEIFFSLNIIFACINYMQNLETYISIPLRYNTALLFNNYFSKIRGLHMFRYFPHKVVHVYLYVTCIRKAFEI